MKEEYDFTNAEQGRFYRPMEELEIPIYLDRDIREVLMKKLKDKGLITVNQKLIQSWL
jgi:hypothetical protein